MASSSSKRALEDLQECSDPKRQQPQQATGGPQAVDTDTRLSYRSSVVTLREVEEMNRYQGDGMNFSNVHISGDARAHLGHLYTINIERERDIESTILRNLSFPSMHLREGAIKDAEERTFEWMFEDTYDVEKTWDSGYPIEQWEHRSEAERRSKTRACFRKWLRAGRGVFHVSGKAGSGKSTLMKFLCDHESTRKELTVWAGEKKLTFIKFFFWKSSDLMQRSLEGLYRTILFETLKTCPDVISAVFPSQYDELRSRLSCVDGALLKPAAIEQAFRNLTKQGTFLEHRFCFFIDGLDEYDGDSVDHMRFGRLLREWGAGDDIKICASSRPYNEYLEIAASADCRIHLHELTRHDIYLFSRQMIERDENFHQVSKTYLELVKEVVKRSEGVFLWARLVVRSILAGMLRHDNIDTLLKKLEVIPRDISELYNSLLGSLEADDHERAVKMLLLTAHSPMPLNSFVYNWIDELEDPLFCPRVLETAPTVPPIHVVKERVQRQLASLTKGLLETIADSLIDGHTSVQFFHRTARDFVLDDPKFRSFSSRFPNLISPESFCRLLYVDLTLMDRRYRLDYWNYRVVERAPSLFKGKVGMETLRCFRCLLDPHSFHEADYFFHGLGMVFGEVWVTFYGMSFVHLAACAGQIDYVCEEVSNHPDLLHGDGQKHIMLSAALHGQTGLVQRLIANGASPMDSLHYCGLEELPVWVVFIHHIIKEALIYPSRRRFHKEVYHCLAFFLKCPGVNIRDYCFRLSDKKDSKVPLWEVVQESQLHCKDQLLPLLSVEGEPSTNYAKRGYRFNYFENGVKRIEPVYRNSVLSSENYTYDNEMIIVF